MWWLHCSSEHRVCVTKDQGQRHGPQGQLWTLCNRKQPLLMSSHNPSPISFCKATPTSPPTKWINTCSETILSWKIPGRELKEVSGTKVIYRIKDCKERSDQNFRKGWTRGAKMSVAQRWSGTAHTGREAREFLGVLLGTFRTSRLGGAPGWLSR